MGFSFLADARRAFVCRVVCVALSSSLCFCSLMPNGEFLRFFSLISVHISRSTIPLFSTHFDEAVLRGIPTRCAIARISPSLLLVANSTFLTIVIQVICYLASPLSAASTIATRNPNRWSPVWESTRMCSFCSRFCRFPACRRHPPVRSGVAALFAFHSRASH